MENIIDTTNFFKQTLIGKTAKVRLRPVDHGDVEHLRKFASDDNIWKYFSYKIHDTKDMDEYVEEAVAQRNLGLRYHFVIEDNKTGKVVGSTAFCNYSQKDSRIEIGWSWLGSESWGQGINQDAKFLLLNLAFDYFNIERVEFRADNLNLRSKGALAKIGATEEGMLRNHTMMPDGRRMNIVYYSILKKEWEEKIKLGNFVDCIDQNSISINSNYWQVTIGT